MSSRLVLLTICGFVTLTQQQFQQQNQQQLQWTQMGGQFGNQQLMSPKSLTGAISYYDPQQDTVWFIGGGDPMLYQNLQNAQPPQQQNQRHPFDEFATVYSFTFQGDNSGTWATHSNITADVNGIFSAIPHYQEGTQTGFYQNRLYYWNNVASQSLQTRTNPFTTQSFDTSNPTIRNRQDRYLQSQIMMQQQGREAQNAPCVVIDNVGNLLVIGGSTGVVPSDQAVGFTNVYNIQRQEWLQTPAPDMSQPRARHSCIMHNGLIYAMGGESNSQVLNSYETLQFQENQQNPWTQGQTNMQYARHSFRLIMYNNNGQQSILLLGGYAQYPVQLPGTQTITQVEEFDTNLRQFKIQSSVGDLPFGGSQSITVIQRQSPTTFQNALYFFGGGSQQRTPYVAQAGGAFGPTFPGQQFQPTFPGQQFQPTFPGQQFQPTFPGQNFQPTFPTFPTWPTIRGQGQGTVVQQVPEAITAYFITISIIMCLLLVALICVIVCFWCQQVRSKSYSTHDRVHDDGDE